jgi:serine phosphatase RsbU (regulator of sigma subunit)
VPPLVFATDEVVVSGLLEPAYDTGGDALDFALNGDLLHFAVFDAMGHGLPAAGLAALALSAYRNARRDATGLAETYAIIDAAVHAQSPTTRFVTALLAQLEVPSGRLHWVSAGHPAPLLLRGGRSVAASGTLPAPPIGLAVAEGPPAINEQSLEPGDQLMLYTDGLTEARRPGGELFTVERLAEFLERRASESEAPPETLRRLRESIIERREGVLRDDATALLVEWHSGHHRALVPRTA